MAQTESRLFPDYSALWKPAIDSYFDWAEWGVQKFTEYQRINFWLLRHSPKLLKELNEAQNEAQALQRDSIYKGEGIPRGDGHVVITVPGWLHGDAHHNDLNGWIKRIGYDARLSGIKHNIGPVEPHITTVKDTIVQASKDSKKVTIIPHSLGGSETITAVADLFATGSLDGESEIQIITLASPFGNAYENSQQWTQELADCMRMQEDPGIARMAEVTTNLPHFIRSNITRIIARKDRIVLPSQCRDPDPNSPTEIIYVDGSHKGLINNAEVRYHLGTLLAA